MSTSTCPWKEPWKVPFDKENWKKCPKICPLTRKNCTFGRYQTLPSISRLAPGKRVSFQTNTVQDKWKRIPNLHCYPIHFVSRKKTFLLLILLVFATHGLISYRLQLNATEKFALSCADVALFHRFQRDYFCHPISSSYTCRHVCCGSIRSGEMKRVFKTILYTMQMHTS